MTASPPPPAEAARSRAARAQSFGGVAADYHGTRSTYSDAAVSWALEPVGPGPVRVLDLAAGTGLLTAALLAHRPPPDLQAVEPDPAMRAEYARHAPAATIHAGTAETIPAPDGGPDSGFDAVVVGTAFHWFDQARALPEIARVLRDGGVLAALWTGPDDEVDWVRAYQEASRAALAPDADPDVAPDAGPVAPGTRGDAHSHAVGPDPAFGEFTRMVFRHTELRPLAELLAAVSTYSQFIIAAPERRAAAVRATGRLLRDRLAAVGPADPDRPDTIAVPVAVTVVRGLRRPRP